MAGTKAGRAEARGLEARTDLEVDGVRKAVLRLPRDGEVRPRLAALAVARVAGPAGTPLRALRGAAATPIAA